MLARKAALLPLALVVLADCNAGVGQEALVAPTPPPSRCASPRDTMRQFYTLLDQGQFEGLKRVMQDDLMVKDSEGTVPLFTVLQVLMGAMAEFAHDAPEGPNGQLCLPDPPANLEFGNRLCRVRRLLTTLLHEQQAVTLIDKMRPVLENFLRYVDGQIPVDGVTEDHYDVVEMIHQMSAIGGKCDPANTYQLLSKTITYLTPARSDLMLGHVRAIVAHPAIHDMLTTYESDGKVGVEAYVTLVGLIVDSMHAIDTSDKVNYFKDTEDLIHKLSGFAKKLTDGPRLAALLDDTASDLKAMNHPDVGIIGPMQNLIECIWAADPGVTPGATLYAALYNLFLAANVLDIPDLLDAASGMTAIDPTGEVSVAAGDALAVLGRSEDAQRAVNSILEVFMRAENARTMMPTLLIMIQKNVLTELGALVEQMLYGCEAPAQ